MATQDIQVKYPAGEKMPPSLPFKTEAAATAILVGEPVKIGGTGNNFVIPLATGDPEIGTDVVVGITSTASNHTATANGDIQVILPQPGLVFSCKATTPANIDTEAKLLAILLDNVTFDLSAGVYTVDEDEGSDTAHGLRIVGGDIMTGDVYFVFRQSGTFNA